MLHGVIPPNTTATIDLPTSREDSVTENGKSIAESRGIGFVEFQNSASSYQVGSGDYLFEAEFSPK